MVALDYVAVLLVIASIIVYSLAQYGSSSEGYSMGESYDPAKDNHFDNTVVILMAILAYVDLDCFKL
jgi:hypothetical protein